MYRIEITADTLTELAGKVMSLAVKLNGAAEPTQRAYAPPVEPVEINPVAPAPVADAPALSFDRDVAPVVLLAVATKGKPFVEAAMAEFSVERASQLDATRWAALIERLESPF